MSRWQANSWLVLISVIWGTTFVVVKESLDAFRPFTLVAARFWVAALALAVLWAWRRGAAIPRLSDARFLRDGMLTGALLMASFVTQTLGLETTEAGKAAFITGLNVVLVPLFAAALLRQPPTRPAVVGVALATGGIALLTLDRALTLAVGDGWVMLCAALFALYIIAIARFAPRYPVLPFTLVQLVTVAMLASAGGLLLEWGAPPPSMAAVAAIVYLGMVATALVAVLQTWVQRYTTPTHTALIFALEPLFAAFFAWLLLGETLQPRQWLGGALILLGMVVTEIGGVARQKAKSRRQEAEATTML